VIGMSKDNGEFVYQLWHSEQGGYTFFERENVAARKLLEPDAKLIWEVCAASFFEAQAKKHEYLGWNPYVPPED
jgi:hypothetical protein